MEQQDDLLFTVDEGIATVTINRPKQRNALSISVSNGLAKLWQKIDETPSIRVVILTSAECGTFCAGLDLKEAARMKAETGEDILTFHRDPFQTRMRRVRVPIIAAMTGHVAAGGMLLSLNADIRVGLAGARIGITETKIGRGSPWGMPLVWMLPEPILMEMTMTGDMYPIEKLEKLGFVNYLEPDAASVHARARQLAERIRDNAPLSVAAGKRAILTAMSVGCDNAAEAAFHIYRNVYASNDAQEGPRAFAEGRAPVWAGN
ncbi:enoyl-CoA hydratase-related protein [Pigmentiphaga sp. GD03639]|uniref:enoyl-CoA hydratase/isomerase family protein n=1 Tax=unclassified Pigmentiphaga TaxID=2626614 RepID=UPI000B417AE0|nr:MULTISPECIES: enoyl-CoA hydratase-related protein [unclassified Pigmentiphaga]MDH2239457.1 enoyl-CoA hydratase-related protein [Pigmentiphaga sp. GD03639]OVZ60468.1 enoyl-CoA hydratase [Pigmentiphaga sp. NML030171]